jgi:hypothetical protein
MDFVGRVIGMWGSSFPFSYVLVLSLEPFGSQFWVSLHSVLQRAGHSVQRAISPITDGWRGAWLWLPYLSDFQFECTQ